MVPRREISIDFRELHLKGPPTSGDTKVICRGERWSFCFWDWPKVGSIHNIERKLSSYVVTRHAGDPLDLGQLRLPRTL